MSLLMPKPDVALNGVGKMGVIGNVRGVVAPLPAASRRRIEFLSSRRQNHHQSIGRHPSIHRHSSLGPALFPSSSTPLPAPPPAADDDFDFDVNSLLALTRIRPELVNAENSLLVPHLTIAPPIGPKPASTAIRRPFRHRPAAKLETRVVGGVGGSGVGGDGGSGEVAPVGTGNNNNVSNGPVSVGNGPVSVGNGPVRVGNGVVRIGNGVVVKRGPSAPLTNTSDEESSSDSGESSRPNSPDGSKVSPLSDHDYEGYQSALYGSPTSPESTSSGSSTGRASSIHSFAGRASFLSSSASSGGRRLSGARDLSGRVLANFDFDINRGGGGGAGGIADRLQTGKIGVSRPKINRRYVSTPASAFGTLPAPPDAFPATSSSSSSSKPPPEHILTASKPGVKTFALRHQRKDTGRSLFGASPDAASNQAEEEEDKTGRDGGASKSSSSHSSFSEAATAIIAKENSSSSSTSASTFCVDDEDASNADRNEGRQRQYQGKKLPTQASRNDADVDVGLKNDDDDDQDRDDENRSDRHSNHPVQRHRNPLPMRLRALPVSFWQQPNVPHKISPASLHGAAKPLPPLFSALGGGAGGGDDGGDLLDAGGDGDGDILGCGGELMAEALLPPPRSTLIDEENDGESTPNNNDDNNERYDGEGDAGGSGKNTFSSTPASSVVPSTVRSVVIKESNPELLFRLFDVIEGISSSSSSPGAGSEQIYSTGVAEKKTGAIQSTGAPKRGRPRKTTSHSPSSSSTVLPTSSSAIESSSSSTVSSSSSSSSTSSSHALMSDEDPYLVENVTEGLLPSLSLDGKNSYLTGIGGGGEVRGGGGCVFDNVSFQDNLQQRLMHQSSSQIFSTLCLKEGEKLLTLPQLQTEANYSQMLSDVVAKM